MVYDLCKKLDPIVFAFQNWPLRCEYPFLAADAIYIKAQEDHRVKSLLIATGVKDNGRYWDDTYAKASPKAAEMDFYGTYPKRPADTSACDIRQP